MNNVFDSSYDLWLVLTLAFSVFAPVALGIFLLKQKKASKLAPIISFVVSAIIAVMSFGAFPCKYSLLDSNVNIKCGIFVDHTIPYSEIISAEKSSNPASAPAWSLDRVEITTKNGPALISPKNRDQFISMLMEKVKSHNQT